MCPHKLSLAIVICTFKRPELLRQTLRSIAAQKAPSASTDQIGIYVVDNSDEGESRAIVGEEAVASPWTINWIEAHPPNISVARNAGVNASVEDFVGFIDDDQELRSGWLEEVVRAVIRSPGDAWLGRVIAIFETPERVTPAVRALFSRELPEKSGYELFAFGESKLSSITLATNNAIFRRSTCLTDDPLFDPAFGKGGGEDYDLFCRLQRRGRRFFWAPEAAVSEFVPAGRCDRSYLWRRFYAGGQAYAFAIARSDGKPDLARWIIRLKAIVQGAVLALKAPSLLLGSEAKRADYLFRWAGVLGKLSFGKIHPIY
jgi:succinoglycan biosynthesis protein ExoM